jgi:hypothetical protein
MESDDEDIGYTGGEELRVDAVEMNSLLNLIYHFFTQSSDQSNRESLTEAMMDGLGYVYYCRKQWRKSTLLMSLESDFKSAVHSKRAGEAVLEFVKVAENPLEQIIEAFVSHKL